MKRLAILVYGVRSYLLFFGIFLYAAGFLTNLFIPKAIDSGTDGSIGTALAIYLGLLSP